MDTRDRIELFSWAERIANEAWGRGSWWVDPADMMNVAEAAISQPQAEHSSPREAALSAMWSYVNGR